MKTKSITLNLEEIWGITNLKSVTEEMNREIANDQPNYEKLFAYAKVIEKLVNPDTDQPNDENPNHFFEIAQLLFEEKKALTQLVLDSIRSVIEKTCFEELKLNYEVLLEYSEMYLYIDLCSHLGALINSEVLKPQKAFEAFQKNIYKKEFKNLSEKIEANSNYYKDESIQEILSFFKEKNLPTYQENDILLRRLLRAKDSDATIELYEINKESEEWENVNKDELILKQEIKEGDIRVLLNKKSEYDDEIEERGAEEDSEYDDEMEEEDGEMSLEEGYELEDMTKEEENAGTLLGDAN